MLASPKREIGLRHLDTTQEKDQSQSTMISRIGRASLIGRVIDDGAKYASSSKPLAQGNTCLAVAQDTAQSSREQGTGSLINKKPNTQITAEMRPLGDLIRPLAEVVRLPIPDGPSVPFKSVFCAKQEWEGVVQLVDGASFTASLTDVSSGPSAPSPPLFAEIPKEEVSDSDHSLIVPGAVFRWAIGYERIGQTKHRISRIVFRRLPQWTKRDMAQAREQASEIMELFGEQ